MIIYPFHGNSLSSKSVSSNVHQEAKSRYALFTEIKESEHCGLFPLTEKLLLEKSEGTFVETEVPKAYTLSS